MSVVMKIDPDEMAIAARRCDQLATKIDECEQECISLNQQLQGCYDGESAVAFDEFCNEKAIPNLKKVSEMCTDTAVALRQTCEQFSDTDATLAKTFRT